ncbi:MAG: hypothetical protein AAGH92_06380 [Planctomycetota bacterium]
MGWTQSFSGRSLIQAVAGACLVMISWQAKASTDWITVWQDDYEDGIAESWTFKSLNDLIDTSQGFVQESNGVLAVSATGPYTQGTTDAMMVPDSRVRARVEVLPLTRGGSGLVPSSYMGLAFWDPEAPTGRGYFFSRNVAGQWFLAAVGEDDAESEPTRVLSTTFDSALEGSLDVTQPITLEFERDGDLLRGWAWNGSQRPASPILEATDAAFGELSQLYFIAGFRTTIEATYIEKRSEVIPEPTTVASCMTWAFLFGLMRRRGSRALRSTIGR